MRILIISLPRTGSTSMLKNLSEEYNLKSIFEPFNSAFRKPYSHNMKNVVVKTIIGQVPNDENIDNYIDWIIDFSKHFDKVILLSRKDLVACTESLSYLMSSIMDVNIREKVRYTSNTEYFYEKPSDDVYEKYEKYINDANITINHISEILKIPIVYYEDIYDLNSPDRLRKDIKFKKRNLI